MLLYVEQILVLTHNSALYMDIMCREHGSFFYITLCTFSLILSCKLVFHVFAFFITCIH